MSDLAARRIRAGRARLTYLNSTDVIQELIYLWRDGGRINKSPDDFKILSNGMPYYNMDVTCHTGIQYSIEPCEEHAFQLQNRAVCIDHS
ncbi:MAG: hypothetical protein WBP84_10550 [Nitrososphaeraceae archaeon]